MIRRLRATTTTSAAIVVLLLVSLLQAQSTPPASPLTLISSDGRRPMPSTMVNGQELVALDDIVSLFQVTVREDNLAGGLTIGYRGRNIVVAPDRPLASVNGRVVSLPSPLVRSGNRWLVPVEFLQRALGPIYDRRIDVRRLSRLIVIGDVRVPRVVARVDTTGPPARVTIEITPATGVSTEISDARVLLRIEADALDLTLPPAGAGLIENVRSGEQPNSLVIALNDGAGPARAVSSTADDITRVTVEVPGRTAASPAEAPARPVSPPATLPVPRVALQTLVIDPGHGGEDIGVRGTTGTEEKQITLALARRLKTLVEARLGIRVVLTRDDDRMVSLDERAAIANNSKADLFLSLHANGAPSPTVAGAEVFHMRLDREGEDARRDVDAQAVALPVLGGGTRAIEVIRWDLAQTGHVDASARLASILEEALRERLAMSPRPLQQAQLRVLMGVNMPAALIEIGYLTNPAEEKRIASDAYQTSITQALYETIVRFRVYLEGRAGR